MIFIFTPPGLEQIFVDHALPARPGEAPPSVIDDDQLARFDTMASLAKSIILPEPS